MIKNIRAGSGFGDSIYLQSVVRHLVSKGESLIVRSDYPDLFEHLNTPVIKFGKGGPAIVAHYSLRKNIPSTSQFQDCCIAAGIKEAVEMRLDWAVRQPDILARHSRPVKREYTTLAVMLPRAPMDRKDGFGQELKPDYSVIDGLLQKNSASIVSVLVGAGKPLYTYKSIDLDFSNKTTIPDLLDIASVADGFVGFCSFMIPLAESLNKPFFALWSSRGLKSKVQYVRSITPEKIIHRKDLGHYAVDSATPQAIEKAFAIFLRQATRKPPDSR